MVEDVEKWAEGPKVVGFKCGLFLGLRWFKA